MTTTARAVTLAALAGLAACADSGQRFNEWAAPFAELGLVPVEPPHEDLRVGDLFVYTVDPEGEQGGSTRNVDRRIGTVGRWASLPVPAVIEQEYEGRPALPATPGWNEFRPEGRLWPEATTDGTSIFATGQVPVRLRQFSMPSGARAVGTDFVDAMIPAEVVSLTTGAAWEDTKGITLSVASAELYSLSLNALLALLVEESGDGDDRGYVLKSEYSSRLPLVAQLGSGRVWVRVISEVLYVRSLDIAIDPVHIDDMEDVPPPNLTSAPPPPPDAPTFEGDPLLQPFERAGKINALLANAGVDQSPGVVTRVVSATDAGVTVRRIWQYPIAIAVRGLTLEVDSGTGGVVRIGTLGKPWSNRPLATAPEPQAEEEADN
jgi:hypothetical protein